MHDQDSDDRAFTGLLQKLLDGRLAPDEQRQLNDLLTASASRRQEYVEHCQFHALLEDFSGSIADVRPGTLVPEIVAADRYAARGVKGPGRPARRLQKAIWFGVTASLLGAVAIVLAWRSSTDQPEQAALVNAEGEIVGDIVARLMQVVGAQFVGDVRSPEELTAGAEMHAGTYELRHGIARIGFDSGAQILAQAPASFKLVDAKTVELYEGRLTVHVTQESVGFKVTTPSADIVDFGTEFGVDVERGKISEVHVFEGEVEVTPHSPANVPKDSLRLITGQASRVDHFTGVPAGINLADQRFLRTLDEPESAYSRRVMELNPAVYYRMEPTEDGLTLRDTSPSGAHGRIQPGHSRDEIWGAGKIGAALRLGGPALQRYGIVPSYPQSQSDEISVVAWVYATSRPRWASIAKNWGEGQRGQFHFGLRFDKGTLEGHIWDQSGQQVYVEETTPLPLDEWHHVAVVADGERLHLYRNRQEVAVAPYRGLTLNPLLKALGIGTKLDESATGPLDTDWSFWDGRLDELAIFNHALTPQQLHELYELSR